MGFPQELLRAHLLANLAYAAFALTCAWPKRSPRIQVRFLIRANLYWGIGSLVQMTIFWPYIEVLGRAFLFLQGVICIGLALLEQRALGPWD